MHSRSDEFDATELRRAGPSLETIDLRASSMEKEDSHEFNKNEEYLYEYYYFAPELYTDENNCLIPNKISGAYSEFKSFIKSNKIPEYAREYKREYQFTRGINKEFSYITYIMENEENDFKNYKLDRIMKYIKKFLRAQEKGKFKDISNLEFDYFDINNIYEIKKNIYYYYSIIQVVYDWSKGVNDESLVSLYEIYKHDLELFLSKLNIEIEDTDDDDCCFDDHDYDIELSFTNDDSDDF